MEPEAAGEQRYALVGVTVARMASTERHRSAASRRTMMIGVLGRQGDRAIVRARRRVGLTVEQHLSRERTQDADQNLEQRGLAGAVR